jgi:hypothetical protein
MYYGKRNKNMNDVEEMETDELKSELDLLYEDVGRSPYYYDLTRRVVNIELELKKRL